MADYSINAVPRRVVYSGSAGVGPYAFTFEVLSQTDIAVYKNSTKLVLTTNYTVTINANGTGSVTLVSAASGGDSIIITGARAIQRTTDFATAGDLIAASLNEQLDANVIFSQQVAEAQKRSLQAPVYDPELAENGGTVDMTLPAAANRASLLMGFNALGNPTTYPATVSNAVSSQVAWVQDGLGAVGRTVESKLRDIVSAFDFMTSAQIADVEARTAAVDVTAAVQAALTAVAAGNGALYLPAGIYKITSALTYSGNGLTLVGDGSSRTILLDTAVAAGSYVLNLAQGTFVNGVTIRDIGFQTSQSSASYGLYCEFSTIDATYNRAGQRFVMDNVEFRGNAIDGNGWFTKGFAKGITLKNVIRPLLTNINLAGRQTSWSASGNAGLAIGIELLSTAAPTDASFRDVQIYSADTAVYSTGHWEGFSFDRCILVAVKIGIDASSGSSYPWLSVQNCHINSYETHILSSGYFDTKIINSLFYKWDFTGSTGLVASSGLYLTGAHRATIADNTFNNLTKDVGSNVEYYPVQLVDTNDAVVMGNVFAGATYGCTFAGTSDRNIYIRGRWTDVPGFGSTPVEFRNTGSGANNVRRLQTVDDSAESGAVTVGTTATDCVSVTVTGGVEVGDDLYVEAMISGVQATTTQPVWMYIVKASGTATINFYNDNSFVAHSIYAFSTINASGTIQARVRVTGRGTLTLKLQAKTGGDTFDIASGDAQIRVYRR